MKLILHILISVATLLATGQLGAQTPVKRSNDSEQRPARKPAVPAAPRPARGAGGHLVEADLEKERTAAVTLQEAPCRLELEKVLERGARDILNRGRGYLIVGRVVLDGPGDPQDVKAQMRILPGGWFAGEVGDLHRPIGFRLHQYAPLDVPMEGRKGSIVDVGVLRMTPLPAEQLVPLKGTLTLEGDVAPTTASVRVSMTNGPVNTPSNGTSPRPRWPAPVTARIDSDGLISAHGFSPMKYYVTIGARGFVQQAMYVTFQPGTGADLGRIELEQPRQISLRYVIAKERPFDFSQPQQVSLTGGSRWKATPDIYGWDLEFLQKAGALTFRSFYAPAMIHDFGPGNLEDLSAALDSAAPKTNPAQQSVESGHVYLLHQAHWKRWIAFRVEVQ